MDNLILLSLVGLASLVVGGALGFVIKGASSSKRTELEKKISFLEADANDGDKIKDAMEAFKGSPEFKAMQELEYKKGLEQGQNETLNRFQVQYEKFSNVEDKWINSIVETGYCMQLYYNGLPVGDVTRRVLHAEKKVNKEMVKDIIERLDRTVNNLIETAKRSQIPTKEVSGLINK